MSHPLELVPSARRKLLFLTFLALTAILFGIFQVLDRPLRTAAAPYGIVSFELAGDPETARTIVDSWKQMSLLRSAVTGQPDPDILSVLAAFGLGLDYLFMPVYALALGFGSLLAAGRHAGAIRSLGVLMGYAAFAAVLFDALENYALLRVLLGSAESGYPALAALCAIIKFGLILLAVIYGLIAWLLPPKNSSSQP